MTYAITSDPAGAITHVVKRVFLKSDGSIESEENTTVTFSRASGNRIHVSLTASKTVIEGAGYCLGDQCHYEATIAPGHRLEFTFHLTPAGLIGLASSTNNGKFSSWREIFNERRVRSGCSAEPDHPGRLRLEPCSCLE